MIISHKLISNSLFNLLIVSAIVVLILFANQKTHNRAVLTRDESSVFMIKALEAKMAVIQVQQWLQDISATRATEGYDDGFDEAAKHAKHFKMTMGEFRAMFQEENDVKNTAVINQMLLDFDNYYRVGRKMAKAYIDQGPIGGNAVMGEFDEAAEILQKKVGALVTSQSQELKESMDSIVTSVDNVNFWIWLMAIVGFLTGFAFAFYIIRNINNLLKSTISNLHASAEQVAAASNEIANSSIQLSEGATQQAASLQETSSSMEEISSQTKANANAATATTDSIQEVAVLVKGSAVKTEEAYTLSEDARNSAKNGAQAMVDISSAMKEIHAGSEKITDIIELINEITHQTKMLATNAAIEAARAGEQGKGFAVVADEVSKLAENSKSAAKEITVLIKESVLKAKAGNNQAAKGEEVLKEILKKSNDTTDLMKEILSSSKEQSKQIEEVKHQVENIKTASDDQANGAVQVSQALVEMDQVTQSNAANSEETASSAEELSVQAKVMNEQVEDMSRFVGLNRKNRNFDSGNIKQRVPSLPPEIHHGISVKHLEHF